MSRNTEAQNTLDGGMYIAGWIALAVVLPLAVWYTAHMEDKNFPLCLVYGYFGVYCPGCGGSRALRAFLEGKLLLSLLYHPIVLYAAVIYVCFMVSQTISLISRGRVRALRFHYWFLYGALIVIGLNCVLKNILKFGFGILLF